MIALVIDNIKRRLLEWADRHGDRADRPLVEVKVAAWGPTEKEQANG